MRSRVLLSLLLMIAVFQNSMCMASEIDRSELDALWSVHMLDGSSAIYENGVRGPDLTRSLPPVPGSHLSADPYIAMYDLRGTTFLGVLRGGGWSLKGGRIARVPGPNNTWLELYAKQVVRHRPGLVNDYFKKKEDQHYEYFLLQRRQGSNRSDILKQWNIPPDHIQWFGSSQEQETYRLRGQLDYDQNTGEAVVTITGLTHPFVERVRLERN